MPHQNRKTSVLRKLVRNVLLHKKSRQESLYPPQGQKCGPLARKGHGEIFLLSRRKKKHKALRNAALRAYREPLHRRVLGRDKDKNIRQGIFHCNKTLSRYEASLGFGLQTPYAYRFIFCLRDKEARENNLCRDTAFPGYFLCARYSYNVRRRSFGRVFTVFSLPFKERFVLSGLQNL